MKNRSSRILLLAAATVLVAANVFAADIKPAAKARLDAEIAAIASDSAHQLTSISALAIRHGKVVYQKQVGFRYLDPNDPAKNKPATAETMYRIASISKLVTSLGVMKLVEQGKLDLDADVSQYLGYPLRNPNFPEQVINLRMLMSHTSSLRDDAGYTQIVASIPLKDFLVPGGAEYAKGKGAMWSKDKAPGFFAYTNLNWGVIGTIMERASGERFDHLMQHLILDPLGLHGGYNAAEFSAQDLANLGTLYRKREAEGKERWNVDGPWVPQTDDYSVKPPALRAGPDYVIGTNGSVFGPQGSLRISAPDLGKIMLMLMNHGRHHGKRILKPASIKTMFAQQWRLDASGSNGVNERGFERAWGLGTQLFTNVSGPGTGDRQVEDGSFIGVGHTGDAWGLTSAFTFNFASKDGMIFMVGGAGVNPEGHLGKYSGKYRYEERVLDALYHRALRQEAGGAR